MFYDSHADAYLTTTQRCFELMLQLFDHYSLILLKYFTYQSLFYPHLFGQYNSNQNIQMNTTETISPILCKLARIFATMEQLFSLLTTVHILISTLYQRQKQHHCDLEVLCGYLGIFTAYAHRPVGQKDGPPVSSNGEIDPNVDYTLYKPLLTMNDIQRTATAIHSVLRSGYIPALPYQTHSIGTIGQTNNNVSSMGNSTTNPNGKFDMQSSTPIAPTTVQSTFTHYYYSLLPNYHRFVNAMGPVAAKATQQGDDSSPKLPSIVGFYGSAKPTTRPKHEQLSSHNVDSTTVSTSTKSTTVDSTSLNSSNPLGEHVEEVFITHLHDSDDCELLKYLGDIEMGMIPSVYKQCFDGGCIQCVQALMKHLCNQFLFIVYDVEKLISNFD
jgi:hypothetical protein